MARANKSRMAITLITGKIEETKKKIVELATAEQYGKACGLQKYKEGLEEALGYVKAAAGTQDERVMNG